MNDNMIVLQINEVNQYGSTGTTTHQLSYYMTENNIKNYVAYSTGPSKSNNYKIGNPITKKIHAILSRITGLQGYYSKYDTKKLIKFMKQIKPNIVQIGNLHGNYINIELLFNYLAENNIATVLVLHDCWLYTGNRVHYFVDECYCWKGLKCDCKRKTSGNVSWFFDREQKMIYDKKKLYNSISELAVIGVSNWITNEAKNSILSNAKIIECVHNWIDLDVFKPRLILDNNNNNYSSKFIILGVASIFDENKGLKRFLQISQYLSEDTLILLVGKVVSKQKLPSNIISVGTIDDDVLLSEYYSLADVFINFSIEESFGKVSAESLACGTPVITNEYTANKEIIGQNCGYIVNVDDIQEVLKHIEKIRINGKKMYSTSCRAHAVKHYSINDNLPKYIDVFNRLLED